MIHLEHVIASKKQMKKKSYTRQPGESPSHRLLGILYALIIIYSQPNDKEGTGRQSDVRKKGKKGNKKKNNRNGLK